MGAAGRMGRMLVNQVLQDSQTELAGAVEMAGSEFLGLDAGTLAGGGACGVKVSDSLAALVGEADAVIDFTSPKVTLDNTRTALEAGCGMVIGTTGVPAEDQAELKRLGAEGGKIVFAPNMSVGVNLLFHLCAKVAPILGEDYDIEVVEMHHNQKKDAPSGTAVRFGEILAEARGLDYDTDVRHGRVGQVGARPQNEIGMHALRGGDVHGDHTIIFATQGERVELTHKASSRETFAKGAVRAAKFLGEAEAGCYDMQDVLGLRG
jgi:4-hydroxy-tetrahydrodipicolinate reductase